MLVMLAFGMRMSLSSDSNARCTCAGETSTARRRAIPRIGLSQITALAPWRIDLAKSCAGAACPMTLYRLRSDEGSEVLVTMGLEYLDPLPD